MSEEKNQTPKEETVEVEASGTEEEKVEETTEKTTEDTAENPTESEEVDYKTKFSESTRENQRIIDENNEKDVEIERLRKEAESNSTTDANYGDNSESLYPGFDQLPEAEQENLIQYTNSIKNKVKEDIYKDPAIAYAKESHNERIWDSEFEKIASEHPQLTESKAEFKEKYFKKENVPDNINDIMKDLAKIYLFDKAKDLGAQEANEQSQRMDIERSSGGDKTISSHTSRSLEDWTKLAEENPAKFAALSEDYNKDLESGKLQ